MANGQMAPVNKPINCNQTGLTGQRTTDNGQQTMGIGQWSKTVSIDLSGPDDSWVNA